MVSLRVPFQSSRTNPTKLVLDTKAPAGPAVTSVLDGNPRTKSANASPVAEGVDRALLKSDAVWYRPQAGEASSVVLYPRRNVKPVLTVWFEMVLVIDGLNV